VKGRKEKKEKDTQGSLKWWIHQRQPSLNNEI
jgi:hypothetical protein